MNVTLSEQHIASLLAWIDEIPISKPKKNITRDFSDGVATAEVVHHFCPKLVELFMYSPANAVSQKMYNWNTLNQKVFRKLGYNAPPELISCIVANKSGYVEYLLFELRYRIEAYLAARRQNGSIAAYDDLPHLPNHKNYQNSHNNLQQQQQHVQFPEYSVSSQGIPGAVAAENSQGAYNAAVNNNEAHNSSNVGAGNRKGSVSGLTLASLGQEKDLMIRELQETIQILQLKVTKLEQLLILKDRRIDELVRTLDKSQP